MPVNAPRMGQHMPAPHHRSMHSPPAGSLRPAGLRRLPRGLVSSPRLHAERRRARQMSQFTLKKILSQGVCYLLVQTLHNRFLSTGTRRLCPQPTGEEGRAAPCCARPLGAGLRHTGPAPGKENKGGPGEGGRTVPGGAPNLELRCQTETSTAAPGGTVAFSKLVTRRRVCQTDREG